MLRVKQTVAPTVEPVALARMKNHLRVDEDMTDDDDFIAALIGAAREYIEGATRRALITQTWRLSLAGWPDGDEIELPKPPLQSVTSVVYTDADGNATEWDSAEYLVDTDSEPGRVVLANGYGWPGVTLRSMNPIQITYVAGYGDDGSAVPKIYQHAIKLLVGHWYENREATVAGTIAREIPLAVESLIWLERVF